MSLQTILSSQRCLF